MHLFPIFIIFSANIEASIPRLLYDTLLLLICMTAISGLPCSKCGVTLANVVFVFCHRAYWKTRKPRKISISSFFEVLRLFF